MKENNEKKLKSFATGLAIGGILAGSGVYASTIGAGNVSYSNASSGISATNAQGAIDTLYKKASTYIDPSYIDFTDLMTNSGRNILGSAAGVCIKLDNKVSCFKPNNYEFEKDHIKEVFSSNGTCTTETTGMKYVTCHNPIYQCKVDIRGVKCDDWTKNHSYDCTTWSIEGTTYYHCN